MHLPRIAVLTFLLAAPVFAEALPDWALGPFTRPVTEPVITPKKDSVFDCPMRKAPNHWESLHTFNPAAVVRDGKICVLYRAEDDSGEMKIGRHTSRLGLATSEDGIHFTREATPVFYPADDSQKENEWEGGCEDPRVVEAEDGTYVLLYTQWNHKKFRIGVATSKDLRTWEKHGPAFAKAPTEKFHEMACKSAGIVTKLVDGRLKAVKIDGKYWMYWGEHSVHLATSDNLVDWNPVEESPGKLLTLFKPRKGHFDSMLTEVGPPPVLTDKGIVLIYNGKNSSEGDKSLGSGAYAGGQALFSATDPTKLIALLDEPFFKPELAFEKTGQYAAGTTFLEGLVFFKDRWFAYYGCADSFVAVATAPAEKD